MIGYSTELLWFALRDSMRGTSGFTVLRHWVPPPPYVPVLNLKALYLFQLPGSYNTEEIETNTKMDTNAG